MGTIVSIQLDAPAADVARAFDWFREVEATCSRFDAGSELRRLPIGTPTAASTLLFEALRFALLVAEETGGAFDPTLGSRMVARGFDRHYATRARSDAPGAPDASFRDIELDTTTRTVLLKRPLTLDLGAVAKGLAIDAAARELLPWRNFCIDAGGDLYCSGLNPQGEPWRIGIRHPRQPDALIEQFAISDQAICTSGDYARGAHILDPRADDTAGLAVSATAIAPNAMLADALATAAFVLGPAQGRALLERMGVAGLIVAPDLTLHHARCSEQPGRAHA